MVIREVPGDLADRAGLMEDLAAEIRRGRERVAVVDFPEVRAGRAALVLRQRL